MRAAPCLVILRFMSQSCMFQCKIGLNICLYFYVSVSISALASLSLSLSFPISFSLSLSLPVYIHVCSLSLQIPMSMMRRTTDWTCGCGMKLSETSRWVSLRKFTFTSTSLPQPLHHMAKRFCFNRSPTASGRLQSFRASYLHFRICFKFVPAPNSSAVLRSFVLVLMIHQGWHQPWPEHSTLLCDRHLLQNVKRKSSHSTGSPLRRLRCWECFSCVRLQECDSVQKILRWCSFRCFEKRLSCLWKVVHVSIAQRDNLDSSKKSWSCLGMSRDSGCRGAQLLPFERTHTWREIHALKKRKFKPSAGSSYWRRTKPDTCW